MKKQVLVIGLMISLGGCSAPQVLAGLTQQGLSPQTISTLTNICRSGNSFVEVIAASSLASNQVKEVTGFVGNYCNQLLAGSVPVTTDLNTISWLERNLSILKGFIR
jgi:hypothetical protein